MYHNSALINSISLKKSFCSFRTKRKIKRQLENNSIMKVVVKGPNDQTVCKHTDFEYSTQPRNLTTQVKRSVATWEPSLNSITGIIYCY